MRNTYVYQRCNTSPIEKNYFIYIENSLYKKGKLKINQTVSKLLIDDF